MDWHTIGARKPRKPGIKWTPAKDAQLIRLSKTASSITEVSKAIGAAAPTVLKRAKFLGIELPLGVKKVHWTAELDAKLKRLAATLPTVAAIERELGFGHDTIRKRAGELGIDLPKSRYQWTAARVAKLRELAPKSRTIKQIAKALKTTTRTVQLHANKLGIDLPTEGYTAFHWTPELDAKLAELAKSGRPISSLARLMNTHRDTIERRAQFLGIELPEPLPKGLEWTPEMDAQIIRLASDREISLSERARRLGITRETFKKRARRLGVEVHVKEPPQFRSFERARDYVRQEGLLGHADWQRWSAMERPPFIPSSPPNVYSDKWSGWIDWLEYPPTEEELIPQQMRRAIERRVRRPWTEGEMFSYARAKKIIRQVAEGEEWTSFTDVYNWLRSDRRPEYFPRDPQVFYGDWWKGWSDFVGPELAPPTQTRGSWPSHLSGPTVGARPWQILPSEPAPEYDPELEVPIQIEISPEDPRVVEIHFLKMWRQLPPAVRRIAIAVGLDMATANMTLAFPTKIGTTAHQNMAAVMERITESIIARPHDTAVSTELGNQYHDALGEEQRRRGPAQPYNAVIWAFDHLVTGFWNDALLTALSSFCHEPYGPLSSTTSLNDSQLLFGSGTIRFYAFNPSETANALVGCMRHWFNIWWQEALDALAFEAPKGGRRFKNTPLPITPPEQPPTESAQLINASQYPYGRVSTRLVKAADWINRNFEVIQRDFYDYFDYPQYWGLPRATANSLSPDEVDFIQEQTYDWAEENLRSKEQPEDQ